ncbi:MAG: GNAT family N-acetyltransferase [Elusimicrobiota bacterium]
MDSVFPDRELFADYWISYHTDFEPKSLFVAEDDNQILGYIAGSFNHDQFRRKMMWTIFPKLILKLFHKGLMFNKKAWSLVTTPLYPKKPKKIELKFKINSPHASLHINLDKQARGQKIGSQLMEKFEKTARERKIETITAGVREDNQKAAHFFKKQGFVLQSVHLGYSVRNEIFNVVIYAKELK